MTGQRSNQLNYVPSSWAMSQHTAHALATMVLSIAW